MKRGAAGVLRLAVRESLSEGPPQRTQAALDALTAGQVDAMLIAAARHRVQSMLHVVLDRPPPGGGLAQAYALGLGGHLRALHDVSRVAQALDGEGLAWAVLKGPALVAAYPRRDLRRYGDLDVLVEPRALGDALVVLEAVGFVVLDTNWRFLADNLLGEVHLSAPGGSSVDLHWSLHNRPAVRSRFAFSTADLLARRRWVAQGAATAPLLPVMPVLDPVDACLHVCVHAGLGGGDLLLWLADVAVSLRQVAADEAGGALVARARATGAEVLTALMLRRAAGLLSLPHSNELVRDLLPSVTVRAWLAAGERVAPVGATGATSVVPPAVARTLAPSPASVLANLATAVRRSHAPVAGRVSVFDAGDPRDRATYLERVAAVGR